VGLSEGWGESSERTFTSESRRADVS
jgi:hypothetical protein